MKKISITRFIYDKIHYSNEAVIYDILNLIYDNNKSKSDGYIENEFNGKIKFYNQDGGESHQITLQDNKTYEYKSHY